MTAPIPKQPTRDDETSTSQVIVRPAADDVLSPALAEPLPVSPSKLPTFVRGRVLARRFLVERIFEVTPQSSFVRAHDLERDRVVLIRLRPRAGDPETPPEWTRDWFRRLDHPLSGTGILGTLGEGVLDGGWPLLVCQYWRGRSLEAFLRSGEAPSLLQVLRIAREVALALDGAHRLGHAHGDLRSDDVWLSHQVDGAERVMVLGFQPGVSTECDPSLVDRDLSSVGDLLSLMVANLLPRYRFATRAGAFGSHARDSAALIVTWGPLTRVAAGCQPSTGGHYRSMAEVAQALGRVESVAQKLSAQE